MFPITLTSVLPAGSWLWLWAVIAFGALATALVTATFALLGQRRHTPRHHLLRSVPPAPAAGQEITAADRELSAA